MECLTFNGAHSFYRKLSDNGESSGNKDMATAAATYSYIASRRVVIRRMLVFYSDNTGGSMEEYGNLGGALTNGILVYQKNKAGEILVYLTDNIPINANADWARECYDFTRLDEGTGDDYFRGRWTFAKSGKPLLLEVGDYFEAIIRDDLSNLTRHYLTVHGYPPESF